jgi:hypothetical protein
MSIIISNEYFCRRLAKLGADIYHNRALARDTFALFNWQHSRHWMRQNFAIYKSGADSQVCDALSVAHGELLRN